MTDTGSRRLDDIAPELAAVLRRPARLPEPQFSASDITISTAMVPARDGVRLATDVYMPPVQAGPAIAMRTPYGRDHDANVGAFLSLARRGYVVVSQDCRGTGGSEPESWDYYVSEPEDSYDLVEWISQQSWFDGFVGSTGGSYVGQTQWCMAMHPAMSAIVPEVSGLGIAVNTMRLHMFLNAYARSVGKGDEKLDVSYEDLEAEMIEETLATGYFNEPLHKPLPAALVERYPHLRELRRAEVEDWLWKRYCSLSCAGRAGLVKELTGASRVTIIEIESLSAMLGQRISHDRHTLPHVRMDELVKSLTAPALLVTGWYDWGLNDAFATWDLLDREAIEPTRSRNRILITPSAHDAPGYHEGVQGHPELGRTYRTAEIPELLAKWYTAVREDAFGSWPRVIYYLMGANEWRAAETWPIAGADRVSLYLGPGGTLRDQPPSESGSESYVYDPAQPTPTLGGSIVSNVYPPGSVDVRAIQERGDVLSYSTEPLDHDLDVAGPVRMVLYASSSAVDTDFVARLTDVFPDGRAIQLQAGALRARYRDIAGDPSLLEPGHVYRLEIDMWATANRFKAGHRVRVDISSADFPKFDRNTNRGGEPGEPVRAEQTVYFGPEYASHLQFDVLA